MDSPRTPPQVERAHAPPALQRLGRVAPGFERAHDPIAVELFGGDKTPIQQHAANHPRANQVRTCLFGNQRV